MTAISLVEPDYNYCVCRESGPILSLQLDPDSGTLWTSTTNSNISQWKIQPDENITAEKFASKTDQELAAPYRDQPEFEIKGHGFKIGKFLMHFLWIGKFVILSFYPIGESFKPLDLGYSVH